MSAPACTASPVMPTVIPEKAGNAGIRIVARAAEATIRSFRYGCIFSIIRGRGTALRLPAKATARAWPLQIEKIRLGAFKMG